jgi:diguanylate cyclase (GGDEF)-like protein
MALSAWQPAAVKRPVAPTLAVLAPPFAFALAALGVLVYGGLQHAPAMSIMLAAGAALASMGRTALTIADIRRLAEVRRQATTDDLTGLPNRRHLDRSLHERLEVARLRGTSVALLLIDLDGFKELNDTLGHRAGDLVLEQIGPRLRAVLRAGDELARLGGDEFAVVLSDAADAEPVGRRMRQALEAGLTVDGIDVRIGASIGIALFPEHGEDAETLLQRADVAMYQAKAARSGHAFYERDRDRHSRERLELIGELRDAIGTEQIILHFQPKLDLDSGRIDDVEALVRWMHPDRGLIHPETFLPLVEDAGLMADLTRTVLEQALNQVMLWRGEGRVLSVAVNLSASSLVDLDLPNQVAGMLSARGIPPESLELEITEDFLMADRQRAREILGALRRHGVRVAVDDFGTGYSSLAYLKELPIDELKLDKSFVTGMMLDDRAQAIVRSTIELAHSLGLRMVAEGVEDAGTARQLAEAGCDLEQGWFYAKAMPAEQFELWWDDRVPGESTGSDPSVPAAAT